MGALMGYMDKTFCHSDCKNEACHRFVSEKVIEGAKKWWGGDDFPLAVSDFSDTCKEYKK